jgi:hypothetical protein
VKTACEDFTGVDSCWFHWCADIMESGGREISGSQLGPRHLALVSRGRRSQVDSQNLTNKSIEICGVVHDVGSHEVRKAIAGGLLARYSPGREYHRGGFRRMRFRLPVPCETKATTASRISLGTPRHGQRQNCAEEAQKDGCEDQRRIGFLHHAEQRPDVVERGGAIGGILARSGVVAGLGSGGRGVRLAARLQPIQAVASAKDRNESSCGFRRLWVSICG